MNSPTPPGVPVMKTVLLAIRTGLGRVLRDLLTHPFSSV